MPLARACSECGASLAGMSPRAITCTNKCRLTRSRRVRRANRRVEEFAEQNNAGSQELAQLVRNQSQDVITRVLKDELAPIVREAITEDVLRAVNEMVSLTPAAVAALQDDLASDDRTIRQRAYTLLIKYTVGQPALVKPADTEEKSQIVVNFSLPRPDDPEVDNTSVIDSEELQTCDTCEQEKPLSEFESGSSRCTTCFEAWKEKILEAFA